LEHHLDGNTAVARRLILDFGQREVYECGADLVSLLTFPSASEAERRERLHASLCHGFLRELHSNSSDIEKPILIKPKYAFRSAEEVRKDRKTFSRRLRDRLGAGHIAIAFLQPAYGITPNLPKGMTRPTIDGMSEQVAEQFGLAEPGNVESRIWRPSLPVVHLAAAFAVAINSGERAGHPKTSIGDIMRDETLIEEIVREAELYQNIIENNKLPIDPAKLVRIAVRRAS
jgi:hypothetical protein